MCSCVIPHEPLERAMLGDKVGYWESKKIQYLNILRPGYHHKGQNQEPQLLYTMGHHIFLRDLSHAQEQLLLFFLQITVLKDCNTRLEFVLLVISGSDINQDWTTGR